MTPTIAYALVQVNNQDTGENNIVTKHGVESVTIGSDPGVFTVNFATGTFNNTPAVSVNQVFNGYTTYPGMKPITNDSNFDGVGPGDAAIVFWVTNTSCRIKTGGGSNGYYRPFSFMAIGS